MFSTYHGCRARGVRSHGQSTATATFVAEYANLLIDIILSPFKPQVKNVTAEDVASSLYYVHLDAPEDELLVPPEQARGSSSPRSSSESRRTKIQRKPLPATANLSDLKDTKIDPATHTLHPALRPDNPSHDSHSYLQQQQPAPNAYIDSAFSPSPQKTAGPPTGPVQRKPFGPRAIATGNHADRNPPPPAAFSNGPPPLPPRQQQHQENIPMSANTHSHSHSHAQQLAPSPVPSSRPIRSPSPNKQRPFRPFSLTLIRRDRSSDEQWNVGKVSAFQCPDPLSVDYVHNHNNRHAQSQSQSIAAPSILIHLESSGYAKFRGMPTRISVGSGGEIRPSFDMRRPHSSGAASASRLSGGRDEYLQASFAPSFAPAPAQGGLEREVKMAYSPSLATNIRQAFKGGRRRRSSGAGGDGHSPTSPSKSPSGGGGGGGHGRHGSSAMSVRSLGGGDFDFGTSGGAGGTEPSSSFSFSSSSMITRPGPGLKPRGYVFDSPWGGRCEFVTGNAGRSLRCRHILPNYTGNVFNPLVADGGGADGEGGTGGGGGGGGRSRGLSGGAIGGGPHHNGGGGGGSHRKALPVSELRFNLPSSEVLFSKDTSGSPRARDQIQGQFQRFLNNAAAARQQQQKNRNRSSSRSRGGGGGSGSGNNYYSSEGDEDFDDAADQRIDMSLGREKAGGGNRGSRAKMGKLIIAPDGLKMLDLVVAANVGVWWTSWERTFGDETW